MIRAAGLVVKLVRLCKQLKRNVVCCQNRRRLGSHVVHILLLSNHVLTHGCEVLDFNKLEWQLTSKRLARTNTILIQGSSLPSHCYHNLNLLLVSETDSEIKQSN
jgi:hypothetical protein